jgi:beta-lactamase regulating signal transducer with metallopeptidase domain
MSHHWEALGWTLIHFCWQAAAIALLYKLTDLSFSKSRAHVRYTLALAALLGMLAASVGTLAYEEAAHRHTATHTADRSAQAKTSMQAINRSLAVIDLSSPSQSPVRMAASDALPYLDAFWLVGVLCLSIRTFGGWWLIHRLRRSAMEKAPYTLRISLDRLRLQMSIPRFVDLRLSSRIVSPLTVGIIRPLILLPVSALTNLSPEQIEVILAHELAHIRRADYFWNILQTMIETLFFFHPAVWWLSRRLREERELCCDDIAVETCHDPSVYATALLRLEEGRKLHLHLAMALDGNQSRVSLRARILRILGDPEETPRDLKPLSLAGVIAALVLFLCPLPQVFASFKTAPKISASLAHSVQHTFQARHVHPAPKAAPVPAPAPEVPAVPPVVVPAPDVAPPEPAEASFGAGIGIGSGEGQSNAYKKSDYIDQMKAAGYDVDIDKYIAMKVQGITPEFAAQMAKIGGEKISADDLIAMKVQDITPDYVSKMRADGYNASIDKYIALKVQNVTPEYADAMAKAGFGKPSVDDLIALKVQGVTPDYAARLRADGIEASGFSDLVSYRIFNVSPEFVAGMKSAGFSNIPSKDLIALRVHGITPEVAKATKQQFPDATVNDLIQLGVFHIDANFIASAKRHGFNNLSLQKLVQLRISGLLDDDDQAKENNQ